MIEGETCMRSWTVLCWGWGGRGFWLGLLLEPRQCPLKEFQAPRSCWSPSSQYQMQRIYSESSSVTNEQAGWMLCGCETTSVISGARGKRRPAYNKSDSCFTTPFLPLFPVPDRPIGAFVTGDYACIIISWKTLSIYSWMLYRVDTSTAPETCDTVPWCVITLMKQIDAPNNKFSLLYHTSHTTITI